MKRTRLMSQIILLRIWRRINSEPQKVFVISEFALTDRLDKVYLDTLVKFGLIEEVQAYWTTGPKQGSLRTTIGYRALNPDKYIEVEND